MDKDTPIHTRVKRIDKDFIECPYSGATVPYMCIRFCDLCIQKKYSKNDKGRETTTN